jgi:hypothetical protein
MAGDVIASDWPLQVTGLLVATIGALLAGWVLVIERRNERRTIERNDVHWLMDRDSDGWFMANDGTDTALSVRITGEVYGQLFLIELDTAAPLDRIDLPIRDPRTGSASMDVLLVPPAFPRWRVTWTTALGTWREAEGT